MAQRAGNAYLPLHGGRVPAWLHERMAKLGRVIVEAIVLEYSSDELLRRLAHPFWFQSFGAVMGMDWHSSGITTSVISALKRGLEPIADEVGIYVCGGRGRHSRKTPAELLALGDHLGVDGDALAQRSRLVAKVDSAALQDGFDLYLHAFIVSREGAWTVVQQGMNGGRRLARRYHWLSEGLERFEHFVDAPHAAIEGPPSPLVGQDGEGELINLADRRARPSREAQIELLQALSPDRIVDELAALRRDRGLGLDRQHTLQLILPGHHDVRRSDVHLRRLHGALAAAEARGAKDFPELLLTPGVGARTVAALAQVAEVIHGAPCRFSDPARFSYAHGGKDAHPFPVPLKVYDRTISTLRHAVARARLGQDDRLVALRRLDEEARRLEGLARGASWPEIVAKERLASPRFGGVSVFGPAKVPTRRPPRDRRPRRQRAPQGSRPGPADQLALPGLGKQRRPPS